MWRRVFMVVVILSLVATAGCGQGSGPAASPGTGASPSGPVTLTFWHTYNTDSDEYKIFVEKVIPAFEAKYPGIKITEVVQPYDGLHDSLVTAVAGGAAPDLMRMDIIWVPEFAKLGALEALDGYTDFAAVRQSVFPGPLATNHYNGRIYGLPLDTNTQVMVYRKDALTAAGLNQPPATLAEFEQFMRAVSGNGRFGHALSSSHPWNLLPWFWTLGGRVTSDDYTQAEGYLNNAASVQAIETIYGWLQAGYLAPTMIGGQPGTWDGFKSGEYAAVLDGPWFFAILGGELGDQMVGAPMPTGPGGSVSVVGGQNIVMFQSAKNKEAAWEFLRFMVSDEAQMAMAESGVIPVTPSAAASPAVQEVDYYADYVQQLATAMPRTPVPTWTQIDDILGTAFESVMRGQASAQAALDEAAAAVDALLRE